MMYPTALFAPLTDDWQRHLASGEDMSDLFITTACATENNAGTVADYPQGGDLFKVRIPSVKGVERHRFGA
jgi:sugar lactone lactonase YvrE